MSTSIVPELSRSAKMRASRAIENVHLAYYQKGGMRDTADKLREQGQSVAKEIFALARFASEQARNRETAIALFSEMCRYAEDSYKREHEVENMREALPTWATLKSNVLRGVRDYALDPTEFRSEGAFRVAMQKKQQAALPAPAGEPRRLTSDELDKLLATTVQLDSVRGLLAQVVFECEMLRKSSAPKAVHVLRKTMDSLAPLVDQRRVGP